MDYLDHHSALINAPFLDDFDAETRLRIADCLLVIARDLHGAPPPPECALIAIQLDSARLVFKVEHGAHMLCLWRSEVEHIIHRIFSEDLAARIIGTLFPMAPVHGAKSCQ